MEFSAQNFFITFGILSVLFIALLAHTLLLRKRLKAIFKSGSGANLDKVIETHLKRTDRLEQEVKRHLEELGRVREEFKRAFQKVEVLRFNSFEETGAQQSFTLALLDGRNNGFILTNLQLRDTARLYVKPVEGGRSQHKLSEEEEATLQKALQQ